MADIDLSIPFRQNESSSDISTGQDTLSKDTGSMLTDTNASITASSILSESGVSKPTYTATTTDHEPVASRSSPGLATPTPTTTDAASLLTPAPTSTASSDSAAASSSGLASNTKVGLGIGIGIGVPILLGVLALCIFVSRKRKSRKRKSRQGQGPYGSAVTNGKGSSYSSHAAPCEMHPISFKTPFLSAAATDGGVHVSRKEQSAQHPTQYSMPPQAAARDVPNQQPFRSQCCGQDQPQLPPHNLAYGSTPYHESAPVSAIERTPTLNTSVGSKGLGLHAPDNGEPPSPVSPVSDLSPVDGRPASLIRGEAGGAANHD